MANKLIKISILKSDSFINGKFKELYRNSVEVPQDVQFDYGLIERAMSLLYPGSFIEFKVCYYEERKH